MIEFIAGRSTSAKQLTPEDTILSIDIGFTEKSRSSGIAIQHGSTGDVTKKQVMYGDLTTVFQQEINHANVHLIIEAPLSMCFHPNGNPMGRGFEVQQHKKVETRYWYMSPGTTTLVAAALFIKKLSDVYTQYWRKVYIYEGFISFKAQRRSHSDDAMDLLEVLTNKREGRIIDWEDMNSYGSGNIMSVGLLTHNLRGIPSVVIPT